VEEKHIRTLVPLKRNHEENVKVIREELEYNGYRSSSRNGSACRRRKESGRKGKGKRKAWR